MTKRDYSGPAFPVHPDVRDDGAHAGMSLRDWLAGQALPAMIEASVRGDLKKNERETNGELISRLVYEMADNLLEARNK